MGPGAAKGLGPWGGIQVVHVACGVWRPMWRPRCLRTAVRGFAEASREGQVRLAVETKASRGWEASTCLSGSR